MHKRAEAWHARARSQHALARTFLLAHGRRIWKRNRKALPNLPGRVIPFHLSSTTGPGPPRPSFPEGATQSKKQRPGKRLHILLLGHCKLRPSERELHLSCKIHALERKDSQHIQPTIRAIEPIRLACDFSLQAVVPLQSFMFNHIMHNHWDDIPRHQAIQRREYRTTIIPPSCDMYQSICDLRASKRSLHPTPISSTHVILAVIPLDHPIPLSYPAIPTLGPSQLSDESNAIPISKDNHRIIRCAPSGNSCSSGYIPSHLIQPTNHYSFPFFATRTAEFETHLFLYICILNLINSA